MDLTLVEAKRGVPCRDGWDVLPWVGLGVGGLARLRPLKALKNDFFFFSLRGSGGHKTLDVGFGVAAVLKWVQQRLLRS